LFNYEQSGPANWHLALIIHADGWLGRAAAEPLNGS
jgi:hypothetical protein